MTPLPPPKRKTPDGSPARRSLLTEPAESSLPKMNGAEPGSTAEGATYVAISDGQSETRGGALNPPFPNKAKKEGRPQPGPLAVSARNKERIRRNGALALLGALLVVSSFTTVKNALTSDPTLDEVTQQVSSVITQDGDNAMLEAVGAQFLQAYLTVEATTEKQKEVDAIINTLTAGNGMQWRKPANTDPVAQRVVLSPRLTLPLTPSATTPGAFTAIYRAFISGGNSRAPEEVIYSVTLGLDENGVAQVVAPPAYLRLPADGKVALDRPRDINGAISNASAAQLTEFLKVWAAAGGDKPDPALDTQLKAWLAPEADRMARAGLGGKFSFAGLESVELRDPAEGSSTTSGAITVRWRTGDGATFVQRYAITVSTAPGGKLQVNRIGPA